MSLYRVEAIVMRTWRYAEGDIIASCYSRELGKIRGIARGARRIPSHFGLSLQLLTHAILQFYIRPSDALYRIQNADVIHSFFSLASEWERLQIGARLVGLVDVVTPEAERNDQLFDLVLGALHLTASAPHPARVTPLFALRLLCLSGYEPELDRCAKCAGVADHGPIAFSPSAGGVMCPRCAKGQSEVLPLSPGTLKFLRRAQGISLEQGMRLRTGRQMGREVARVLLSAYAAAIGGDPRLHFLLGVEGEQGRPAGVSAARRTR